MTTDRTIKAVQLTLFFTWIAALGQKWPTPITTALITAWAITLPIPLIRVYTAHKAGNP